MHQNKKKRGLSAAVYIILIFVLVAAAALIFYFLWEKAPDVAGAKAENVPAVTEETPAPDIGAAATQPPEQTPEPTTKLTPEPTLEPIQEIAPTTARQDGVYTIMLAGEDQSSGNTDTILVGKIDTNAHKMDFVSIPRDTLLNMDGDVRKINCVYYKAKERGADPAQELKNKVTELIGFEVDCYAVINLQVFMDVVDAIGGVDYTVQQDIWMDDAGQNLFTYLPQGEMHLNGYQAMCLVRYRAGYADADLGRIEIQHDFLKTVAKQMISLGNIPNLRKVINILTENVDTDLTAANMAYFARQALMCSDENINFYTVPTVGKTLGEGYSYAVILVYQWVPMINDYLNPYSEEITMNNINVMFNDYFGIGCTGEIRGGWYYVGLAEAEMQQAMNPWG